MSFLDEGIEKDWLKIIETKLDIPNSKKARVLKLFSLIISYLEVVLYFFINTLPPILVDNLSC